MFLPSYARSMPSATPLRPGRILSTIALAAALLLPAAPAAAHDELVGSDPAAGAVLGESPEQITLTFSNAPMTEDGATEVAVFDEECSPISSADPVISGVEITQTVDSPIDGAAVVQWKTVSSDGHPISGQFTFTVGTDGARAAAGDCVESTGQQAEGGSEGFNAVPYAVGGGILFVGIGVVLAIAIARGRRGGATKS